MWYQLGNNNVFPTSKRMTSGLTCIRGRTDAAARILSVSHTIARCTDFAGIRANQQPTGILIDDTALLLVLTERVQKMLYLP